MPRKKLIEVSIPLEAINAASAREKSIRHGHPSTLHLYWARRPLAACRAVLFSQLVDDPSSWPDRFPTVEEQDAERRRLHGVIERMVPWEASNDEGILNEARWEIARSVAWGRGEEPPERGDGKAILAYLQEKAPPVYDPFSGGGSIPLEAQRLGLRAYGSDLNPLAVLIGKALVEIPPKFAGLPPVNPEARADKRLVGKTWRGAQGLAEDVRYYGRWMCEEAERRIGHLYPKAKLPDGSEATVIAWLWARTVRSPDPAAKGAMVPLVSSFLLASKGNIKSWAELVIDQDAQDGWRFLVKEGLLSKVDAASLAQGTKSGRANFRCALTGANIDGAYIDTEGRAGRLSERLMAIVAEGNSGKLYITPDADHENVARVLCISEDAERKMRESPTQKCRGTFASNAQGRGYGFDVFSDYFKSRQLILLRIIAGLVGEVRTHVANSGGETDGVRLSEGGAGVYAYADAVATYLAFANSRMVDRHSTLTRWDPNPSGYAPKIANTFSRQAISMTWDYAEGNPFSNSSGNFEDSVNWIAKNVETLGSWGAAHIRNSDASSSEADLSRVVVSTDPPYYDNICYADLSDYFYVWLRISLADVWPDLFRRLTTPKDEELVATPYRHGSKDAAEAFFMKGMGKALTAMRKAATEEEPLAIYYAFKQSEVAQDGVTSAGWAAFLQAVVDAGLAIDGTWPIRTELANRMIGKDANALASSIVLVCRRRNEHAETIGRADFLRALKRELPAAIEAIRKAGVGPVDMQQSVIGPAMGVFTRYAAVLEDDDSAMPVKTALALINRVWGEIESELDLDFDAETQVALAWYDAYGFDERPSGDLIVLATAKNIPQKSLFDSGVFVDLKGKTALARRDQLPTDWRPSTDKTLTVWECVQHTARTLRDADGGYEAAARLVAEMGPAGDKARKLAYRLFEIATTRKRSDEAQVYNELAQDWSRLETLADTREVREAVRAPAQKSFDY